LYLLFVVPLSPILFNVPRVFLCGVALGWGEAPSPLKCTTCSFFSFPFFFLEALRLVVVVLSGVVSGGGGVVWKTSFLVPPSPSVFFFFFFNRFGPFPFHSAFTSDGNSEQERESPLSFGVFPLVRPPWCFRHLCRLTAPSQWSRGILRFHVVSFP